MRWQTILFALFIYSTLQWISFKLWTLFHNEEDSSTDYALPTKLSANTENDNLIVIYNKIPKTGSTSFMHLPYELCETNQFHVLLLNISNPHAMTLSDRQFFAKNISEWRKPAVYHGHFAYFDVQNMGVTIGNNQFVYINVVRNPLER